MEKHLQPLGHEEYGEWLEKHLKLKGNAVLIYYPKAFPIERFHKPKGSELDLQALTRIALLHAESEAGAPFNRITNVLLPKGTIVKGELARETRKLVRLFHCEAFEKGGAAGIPAYEEHERLVKEARLQKH